MVNWKWWSKDGMVDKKNLGTTGVSSRNVQNMATFDSFVTGLQNTGNWDLSFHVMKSYYKNCAPLADAIDKISEGVASLPLIVKRRYTDEVVPNHPILKLLNNPNTYQSKFDFMFEASASDLNLGNEFIRAIGNVNRPPLSLDIENPAYANLQGDNSGELGLIMINNIATAETYSATLARRRTRFYNKTNDMELWPLLRYNPDKGSNRFWGMSRVRSLYYSIEQFIAAGRHNFALLSNGGRPSGVLTSKNEEPMTDEQITRMQDHLNRFYAGPQNAGRMLMMENFEFKEMGTTNKDMDYKEMYSNVKVDIYGRYNIPLPKVTSAAMTFSNMAASELALYDNAILPEADYLLGNLALMLFPRYGDDPEQYELTYDESKISALRERRIMTANEKSKVGVNTVNELRHEMDDPDIDGGDVILRPANDIPALDYEDGDNTSDNPDDEELEKALRNRVDSQGESLYGLG